jgi:hypothetical protein
MGNLSESFADFLTIFQNSSRYAIHVSRHVFCKINSKIRKNMVGVLNARHLLAHRKYARRQRTWFRREPLFHHWLYRNEMGVSDLLARTTDLYSMPFTNYMDTFDWETYLNAMTKDYNKSMREYVPKLQLFASASSRSHFLAALAPRIRDLRQWYAHQQAKQP